ncbi:SulP family inorganic anion transporter [Curvibacter sp. HBC28]|uniref:SulP family inorganic anion transporter n=1 Tax=Curvibacter microcysteis TaxID=3026419 RepID=A0ABT5MEC6_9BURK|nr:SulP family inorganic anion transporter [Curvibacter sp. HBC28]MDD0814923.1 SulP family inorganic anion transporter [Curvibacter sp. HBC28]
MINDRLHRLFPFLNWPRPSKALLLNEFAAGMTVGLMLLPQGVAYAALAGMPLVTGIYASIVPAVVAVLWSSSTRLGVGPTALSSLLIGASLSGLAEPGSDTWVSLAVWLALFSGGLQLLLGLGRFGWLLNLVSSPVLSGFTQAAALLILGSQMRALSGMLPEATDWLSPNAHDLNAVGFGLGSLLLLLAAKRWVPRWPAAILVVIGAGALSAWTGFAQQGGAVVGALPAGLPSFYWPSALPLNAFGQLIMPALVITLISFLETASSAKVENQRGGTQWNENQDLIGQGLAKIASGLSGSFPISASFSRSAVNLYAGAKTGWATLFSVLLVVVVLLFLTPYMFHVPQAVLAAIVVAAVLNLIKPQQLLGLWKISRVEAVTAAATFALTLLTAPQLYWGVLAGLIASLTHFLYQRLHPRIIEVGLHPDGSLRDRHLWHLPLLAPDVLALRMDAELDFASASTLERHVVDQLAQRPDTAAVCLFAQPINRIDVTGVEAFQQITLLLHERGIALFISGLKLPVDTVLRRAGCLQEGPLLFTGRTDAETLTLLQKFTIQR